MIAVTDVKSHLIGLGPWLEAAALSKYQFDDSVIANKSIACIRDFERKCKFRINPIQIVGNPDGTYDDGQPQYSTIGPNALTPYASTLIYEDGYAYRRSMAQEYFTIELRAWPVQTVQRVRVAIGHTTVFTMPSNWYSIERKPGTFSIQPVYGPLLISSLNAFSALEFTFGPKDYLRNSVFVDYTSGLGNVAPNWQTLAEFSDLYRCLTQMTALQILYDIAQLADAGLIQVSAGGDTRSYSRFKDRKEELKGLTDDFMSNFTTDETPPVLLGSLGG